MGGVVGEAQQWLHSLSEWGQGFMVGAILCGLVGFLFGASVASMFFVEEIHSLDEEEMDREENP